jgi:nucleoside phosphorylase
MRPQSRSEFETAIICALPLEFDAVEALFDEHYDDTVYGKQQGDENFYRTGRISQHSIVLACLPGIGKGSAASVASNILVSFVKVNLALVVGICGGVPYPSANTELILGDVIISDSIVEYDFGSQYPDGFQPNVRVRETLDRTNRGLRTFLSGLKTSRMQTQLQEKQVKYFEPLQKLESKWRYPGAALDQLFEASYCHKHQREDTVATCICTHWQSSGDSICGEAYKSNCNQLGCKGRLLQRSRLSVCNPLPHLHFGPLGSGDTVIKSGEHRDRLARRENIIGFEMEGAGVCDNLPCLIIKGVCDYADSHKHKLWQHYAAASAASCAKAFLESLPKNAQGCK